MIKTKNIDIQNLVVDLGICKGDYVMIHADMISLGVIENNAKDLINILLKIVGSNGLILTPSFTFSFSINKIFDVEKSITKVGTFSKIY